MAERTKHTPGPWEAVETGYLGAHRADETPITADGGVVATAWPWGEDDYGVEMRQANARLIAAAPDLLKALETIASNSDEPEAVHCAREAIEKATGASDA